MSNYEVTGVDGGVPIKSWTRGVPFEGKAREQLQNVARLPFVFKHVAAMPDVHLGIGATVGSVVATRGAVVPAAVGVDIGCGMQAALTSLTAPDLPDDLRGVRSAIEAAVPHGRTDGGGGNDEGAWRAGALPGAVDCAFFHLLPRYDAVVARHPGARHRAGERQLGTLGTGNHFVEVCLDESDRVWFMLHSGSRGPGNRIGTYFIEKAKEEMRRWMIDLPDADLAYLPEGSPLFADYVEAVTWAQDYASMNRALMMDAVTRAVGGALGRVVSVLGSVDCHHNYVAREHHFGENVLVTRKGAVRAREGDLGIIPGSMGARSFIVRGRGCAESFHSCSHGAGRRMSRTEARKTFTVEDHERATAGVECRKDEGVVDETPGAYKDVGAVMAAQADLVEVVHTLKQVVCVKG